MIHGAGAVDCSERVGKGTDLGVDNVCCLLHLVSLASSLGAEESSAENALFPSAQMMLEARLGRFREIRGKDGGETVYLQTVSGEWMLRREQKRANDEAEGPEARRKAFAAGFQILRSMER